MNILKMASCAVTAKTYLIAELIFNEATNSYIIHIKKACHKLLASANPIV